MLSDAQIRRAKPGAKDYKLSDGEGLYLLVTKAGARSWRLKYRFGGKEKLLTFGLYPAVSLAAARAKRETAKVDLAAGNDPGSEQKRREVEQAATSADTFQVVAREWHAAQQPRWLPETAERAIGDLERDLFPKLGVLPIAAITTPMIVAELKRVEKRSVDLARRLRRRVFEVYDWAVSAGRATGNPTPSAKSLGTLTQQNLPALTDIDDVRALLAACEAVGARPITMLAHRFVALTAIRSETLRSTPWAELQAIKADGIWKIPAARMKGRARDFWLPLSTQALEVIQVARELTGNGPLAFPNAWNAHKPMSEAAINAVIHRAGYAGRHVTHGWRSSFSTIMNERHSDEQHVIDFALAHIPANKVQSAYNRALYLDRRRDLAQEWADLLMRDLPPATSFIEPAKPR